MTADPALVAEAKKVHRRFVETEDAVAYIGGLPPGSKPPKEFTELLMDEGLARTMLSMEDTFKAGVKRKSGETKYGPLRVVSLERTGSIITLRGCRDGRGLLIARADGSTYSGILVRHTTYYKRDKDGRLKINFWTSVKDDKCK